MLGMGYLQDALFELFKVIEMAWGIEKVLRNKFEQAAAHCPLNRSKGKFPDRSFIVEHA